MALRGIQEYIARGVNNINNNINNNIEYYSYRAFGGQNKIVYSTRFVTRRAIFF